MNATRVWVHRDGWAGRRKIPGELLKRNPKRSLVRYEGREGLVPNFAITPRTDGDGGAEIPALKRAVIRAERDLAGFSDAEPEFLRLQTADRETGDD